MKSRPRTPRYLRPLAAAAVVMSVLVPPCVAEGPKVGHVHHDDDDDFRTMATAHREERVAFPAGSSRTLTVDLVWGEITVIGEDRADAAIVVEETVRARDAAALERARREVRLDIGAAQPSGVRVYADGPFRCAGHGKGHGRCDSEDLPYVVHHAVTVRVPRNVDLDLANVLEGDVTVKGVRPARFEVRNVNGGLRLDGLAGSGSAKTVNGDLRATFAVAPAGACSFETVNGEVDLAFPAALAADVEVSTLNGEAWSDFPYTATPRQAAPTVDGDGRHQLRGVSSIARVGGGGPQLRIATINGDVFLRRSS